MNIYDVVDEFENRVCEYSGAKYGISTNSCTNALMLSVQLRIKRGYDSTVTIPKHTYVGVPCAIINAGGSVLFEDVQWHGAYALKPLDIIDSARRFRKGMYEPGTLYCLSFHECKILPIGDGGMILTDDKDEYDILRKMRFDGRTPGVSVFDDEFIVGHHCHMKPDVATRGLMLMAGVKDYNADLPEMYPDLSKIEAYRSMV
jgi:dTDP-4-amino-4,6-dideoxygalactose transaminase